VGGGGETDWEVNGTENNQSRSENRLKEDNMKQKFGRHYPQRCGDSCNITTGKKAGEGIKRAKPNTDERRAKNQEIKER